MLSPAFKSSFEIDWPSTPAAVCAPQMVIGLRDWAGPARVGANWSKRYIDCREGPHLGPMAPQKLARANMLAQ